MDLMYFGYDWDKESSTCQYDFIKEITEVFPNVVLKDAYDGIKGYRQEVWLDETEKEKYYAFLIGKGWHQMSMSLQLGLRSTEEKDLIMNAIELAKELYLDASKNISDPKPNHHES